MEFLLTVCKNNTPVFNKTIFHSFDDQGNYQLCFDSQFLIRSLETILYCGTPIKVIETIQFKHMQFCKITCSDYPSKQNLFVIKENTTHSHQRTRSLPTLRKIQEKLKSLYKTPYLWGGTLPHGLKNDEHYFKSNKILTPFEEKCFRFEGLDCSGLLYHVTNGYTPRNTSHLMNFGRLTRDLKPLDLILWPGHCIIILDENRTIEAREFDGLIICPLKKRLSEIKEKRKWVESINSYSQDSTVYTTRRFLK